MNRICDSLNQVRMELKIICHFKMVAVKTNLNGTNCIHNRLNQLRMQFYQLAIIQDSVNKESVK